MICIDNNFLVDLIFVPRIYAEITEKDGSKYFAKLLQWAYGHFNKNLWKDRHWR